MMMMEAADGSVSSVRKGRRAEYHVVDATATAMESSSSSQSSRLADISTDVDDSSNGNGGDPSNTNTEIIEESSSNSNSIIILPSFSQTPTLCFRILIAIIIALVLDIIVLSAYVYQQPQQQSSSSSPSSSSGANAAATTSGHHDELGTLSWKALPPHNAVLTKVAFGSCMSQKMPHPHWDTLISLIDPIDLLLLMGDNVYGDCTEPTCQTLHQAYIDFEHHASVQGAAPQLAVMATLDDHDYGQADCHADNPYKDIAKRMFQKVFNISNDELPSSSQTSSGINSNSNSNDENAGGVYRAKTWGPPGQRLQIIMLDTRYGRSPFFASNSSSGGNASSVYYAPPPHIDDDDYPQAMLSQSQWTWLHEQLNQPAVLRLIVSSIQVLNDVTGYECWRHLPKERQRLYDLLRQTQQTMIHNSNSTTTIHNDDVSNPEGPSAAAASAAANLSLAPILLLSGDRHVGGFYATDHDDDQVILHEVTASSWTHSFPLQLHNDTCLATPALCEEDDPRRIGRLHHENNFATLQINWSHRTYTVALQKTDSTYGITYLKPEQYGGKGSDAGSILDSHSFRF